MVDGEKLAQAGFRYIGTSYKEMDCQKFIERCLKDCGNSTDLAGSNAWYRECRKNGWVGSPEECKAEFGKIPNGAFLFIHAFDGGEEARGYHDGLGNASHIGIVTGTGQGAIHSSESKGGVCESAFKGKTIKNGGWNKIGLWTKAVDYHMDQPTPDPDPDPQPEPDPEPEREWYQVKATKEGRVNTRTGPDETYKQAGPGKIKTGSLVEVIKRKINKQGEEWANVIYQDERGAVWYCWIKAEFLEPAEQPEPDPEPAPDPDPEPTPDPDPDPDPGPDYQVTVQLQLTRSQAEALLQASEALSWQLMQILGSVG